MIIGILKVKVLAMLLGPTGVGLMGLYQNILGVASTMAGCGLGNSGVQQLAASKENTATLALVRRALFLANLLLGLIGMAALWLIREPVSKWVFGDAARVDEIGWIGFGVLLSLLAVSQTTLLQGMRRIGDLARVNIISSVIGAIFGVLAIGWLGMDGVLWFTLTVPAAGVLAAAWYVSRLPGPEGGDDLGELRKQWQVMFLMGIPVMAGGLSVLVTLLFARSLVLQGYGLDATGFYQAAWAVSMAYIGFVLNAMGMDYFPRLASVKNDRARANSMANEQTEMALLLAGPILLAMMTFAPWVISLLYSESFASATELLRWQVMGDIAKIMSWPMGFVALALGRGGVFFCTQLAWNAIYLLIIWLGLPEMGLVSVGVGYLVAYVVLFAVVYGVARQLIGFRAAPGNVGLFAILMACASGIHAASAVSFGGSVILGVTLTMLVGAYCIIRLNKLMDLAGWLRLKLKI